MQKLILAVGLLAVCSLVWTAWPFLRNYFADTPSPKMLAGKDFVVIGHRGAAGHAPENTMASFKKALELGAEWIELDVHRSKDGQLVVMHDATVDRTTNGEGDIADLTFNDLRKLDAGSWYSAEFAGEKVPSLSDAIREINGQAMLLVEIKWPEKGIYEGLGKEVAAEIVKYGAQDWCIIQSFESRYLEEAAQHTETVALQKLLVARTSLLFMPVYQDNHFHMGSLQTSDRVTSVNYYHKALTESIVAEHHLAGKKVMPYTVNTKEDMLKALGMGVDGLITDFPDLALQLKKELQHGL